MIHGGNPLMHILIVPSWYPQTPNDVSGVFFRDQALALRNYGHEVGVLATSMRSLRSLARGKSTAPVFENDQGLLTYRKEVLAALPRLPYGNFWLLKRAARKLFKRYISDHGKPDILHAHAAIFGGTIAAELSREFDLPLVLTEHSTGFARKIYSGWQLKLAQKAMCASTACIAVSPALAQLLKEKFPENGNSWLWIPNVVADRFKKPEPRNRRNRPIRFLNLALMTEKKGQFDLVQAFSLLEASGLDTELWLAGDGPIRSRLELMAHDYGVYNRVKFLGMVSPESVPNLLAEADVMVVSSHYETFGVVAAEALMAGIPVVSTRCGGPECIVEIGDGLLVEPRDPEKLAAAMLEISKNIDSYDSSKIISRARRRFSGSAIAAQLTCIYEQARKAHAAQVGSK
jgi:L-malate glycosyltransferase